MRRLALFTVLGTAAVLACVYLLWSGSETPPTSEPASGTSSTRRGEYALWRELATPDPRRYRHGFLSGHWRMTEGPMHYFVSELLEVEVTDSAKGAKTLDDLAVVFRNNVQDLVSRWGDRPEIGTGFAERHFFADADEAELARLRYLDGRKGPNVEIHRLFVR